MLRKKPRKPEVNGYESCPECGAIKRYALCLGCGWISERDKRKDKKLLEAIINNERAKPKVKKKQWGGP